MSHEESLEEAYFGGRFPVRDSAYCKPITHHYFLTEHGAWNEHSKWIYCPICGEQIREVTI